MINVNSIYERFLLNYHPGDRIVSHSVVASRLFEIEDGRSFLQNYAGCTFGDGVYRVLSCDEIKYWNEAVLQVFSQHRGSIECFATDWMGRVFSWDFNRNKVILLDPGFGQALNIPCSFIELHNQEFVDFPDESLSRSLYRDFCNNFKSDVSYDQCVGYKISPFLGGEDNLDNMETVDMKVYWSISSDIFNQVKEL